MSQQQQQNDKRTASQRIEDLERTSMATFQTIDAIARDIMILKEAVKLLGNKVDAVVKATNRGLDLSDDVLSEIMVENNVDDLKRKVQDLVTQGILVQSETVTPLSFVVTQELNEEGKVINPRLQFTVNALTEAGKLKILGKALGDSVPLSDNANQHKIIELYQIVEPAAPTAQAQETQPDSPTAVAPVNTTPITDAPAADATSLAPTTTPDAVPADTVNAPETTDSTQSSQSASN